MATKNDSKLPISKSDNNRSAVDFLPKYFRTAANTKFLSGTIDQLISTGEVDKLNGYIGRTTSRAYKVGDKYVNDISLVRDSYQLEPAIVVTDDLNNVTTFTDYNDYINQINYFDRNLTNHEKLNAQESYSWNPHIAWDKFVNYREYYWLPSGPQGIAITGQANEITSTYSVTLVNDGDNVAYVFTPDGRTRNPSLKLYRGQTYIFDIDCVGHPISFKTTRTTDNLYIWEDGIESETTSVEQGTITFTVPENAPELIYYVSDKDINTSGFFKIYDIEENTSIDVDNEIIGKKTYTASNGIDFSNGMKVYFIGNVTPEKYATGNWYVEGVGDKISLVEERSLESPSAYATTSSVEFDNSPFDESGYDVNNNFPSLPDYIVINKASKDLNPWSRYNRWTHRNVIETAAAYNNQPVDLDQNLRAKRPIIEFDPNLKLWNFGTVAKKPVDLVDLYTKDVFSNIEGAQGYTIDGVPLLEGMRVLFTADTDVTVNGRIFKVSFITHLGVKRISLVEEEDTQPLLNECVLVYSGTYEKGKMYHYNGTVWVESQSKSGNNAAPLFDLFDSDSVSYGDTTKYDASKFTGTKIFSYKDGDSYDSILGMNVEFRNIGNIGDILFEFNLQQDTFVYQENISLVEQKTENGYLKQITSLTDFNLVNGWIKTAFKSKQPVIRQYDVDQFNKNFFAVDVYEKSGDLNDLEVQVFVNHEKRYNFEIYRQNRVAYIQFDTDLVADDVLIIESRSNAEKVSTIGYYKFPNNLESNPNNESLNDVTLGEVINHVRTITHSVPNFNGAVLGVNNLRDLGNTTKYGTQIVQHSGPLAPLMYFFTNKDVNVINSLRYANNEYSKFKRNFSRVITELGFDGLIRDHLDAVIKEINQDKTEDSPYFLSDMIPIGSKFIYEQTVIDDSFTDYPLTFDFNLDTPTNNAVLVYLNEDLLLHGKDYEFVNDSFVRLIKPIQTGDELKIAQYENSIGCCIPPTPTKLGMYPLYEPQIFTDNTYQTPVSVIQGHDGSITVAYGDYRDELILELEKRIFNNIKVTYDPSLLDVKTQVATYDRDGINPDSFNKTLRADFLNWTKLVNQDYTKHDFFERSNAFTFNHSLFTDPKGTPLKGFWRAIYKNIYDTDRPHTHPWEMLGFTIEPKWWRDVYGPAPYTSNNLILWQDLRDGAIKEPGMQVQYNKEYARPDLLDYIPVDDSGNLLAPVNTKFVKQFVAAYAENNFTFGDETPIETAWRRSSQYPFALITGLLLHKPAEVFSCFFDRTRQFRDQSGQIVYKTDKGNLRFNTKNIVYPATTKGGTEVTSGLINYINEYAISKSFGLVDKMKDDLQFLKVKIASKLAGFTAKEKFKLILDSKSPLNQQNVFIPEENYQIILNTSTPVASVTYSGVIIEKRTSGFVLRGYNKDIPEFKYYKAVELTSDPVVNIGGISESFVNWASGKYYSKGQIVRAGGGYYRTTTGHTSSSSFEEKYFVFLDELPITGGRNIIIRKTFDQEDTLHYGAELPTIQSVVDFLLGYGYWLEQNGFEFDDFNAQLETVTNWQTSAREFAFWTTQNWANGAVITVSPGADGLVYTREYSTVDNIYDPFYEYSIYKQDGLALDSNFTNTIREENQFSIKPVETADGIYHATFNSVQKEHVLILDDVTVFSDTIYDKIQGYRQERIKVLGYRIADWKGDFNIAGFFYDQATVSQWQQWTDYALGETVKYKEFYYSAKLNVPGSEKFNESEWFKLGDKPESKLVPNWDYQANQFADFYDLDTDSFDISTQTFAQHLIGYQKRQYLENIINNDVSQYKFYQGMIQDKGTQNSLNKLFDVLAANDQDSLEFYEEWAIRLGQYGASEGFEEVEYILEEEKFLVNPQPIELVFSEDPNLNDFVYRIKSDKVYIKPEDYNHAPIPTVPYKKPYIKTAGYVNLEDIQNTLSYYTEIADLDSSALRVGDYIWVGFDKTSWGVYRFTLYTTKVRSFVYDDVAETIRINLLGRRGQWLEADNFIVAFSDSDLSGTLKIVNTGIDYIVVDAPSTLKTEELVAEIDTKFSIYNFTKQRINSIDNLNDLPLRNKKEGELVWVDGTDNNWSVWKFTKPYTIEGTTNEDDFFSNVIATNTNETFFASTGDNLVQYYSRPTNKFPWRFKDQISPLTTETFTETNESFGESLCFNADGSYLFIGAPAYGLEVIDQAPPLPDIVTELYQGYVAQYTVNDYGTYNFTRIIQSDDIKNGEFFGKHLVCNGNTLLITMGGTTPTKFADIDSVEVMLNPLTINTVEEHNLTSGQAVQFNNVNGLDGIEGTTYYVDALSTTQVALYTDDGLTTTLDGSLFSEYVSDGEFISTDGVNAGISVYNMSSNTIVSTIYFDTGVTVNDISMSSASVVVVSLVNTDGTQEVRVYQLSNSILTLQQTITINDTSIELGSKSNFGASVAITKDSNTIAIGAPGYTDLLASQGAIAIFELSDTYVYKDLITSPIPETGENFGQRIRFTNDGTKLAVYSQGGDQTIDTLFDGGTTTFDLTSTKIVEVQENVGSVRVYERYNTKFLFADELEPSTVAGVNYGSALYVSNSIYTNDYTDTAGIFYEFKSSTTSWVKVRQPEPVVDVEKIKSVFLYDRNTQSVIANLDFVDPINGKILGIAEQELSYKTYYDPAVYNTGTDEVVVDELMPWTTQNVGKLWWDLSAIKFIDPKQGNILYKANSWNNVFNDASVDVYEWVQSEYSPEEWDELADTEQGLTEGISGQTKYGADVYSFSQTFDNVSQTFKNVYYFWVKNKSTVPTTVDFRNTSARDVADLIADPKAKGVQFISLINNNQFSLVNCKPLIKSNDIVLNIRYWVIDKNDINVHSHYQLLAEGDISKKLNPYLEQKWFDSLIGEDSLGREVPTPSLPHKLKYGILSKPRQSMFINKREPLKQLIERANSVLINQLLVDDFKLDLLKLREPEPTENSGKFDIQIETISQLRFVNSSGAIQAAATAVVEGGKIKSVTVTNPGRGYVIPPNIEIISETGEGAKLSCILDSKGSISSITVDNAGRNYRVEGTLLTIRPFTILVLNDETAANKWSMYTWSSADATWFRSKTQVYDVTKHWDYVDWYAQGYSSLNIVDFVFDFAYEMSFNDIRIGDLVKIKNQGIGGWILLEKIDNQNTDNVLINYKTVGRENGTIQFSSNLYKFEGSNIGFDSFSFDGDVYDDEPKEELRYILNSLKTELFIGDLEVEYNKLFFTSLRYVHSEQGFVDWAFKTSFIKAKHNLGDLQQKVTYKSDNLESYEDYINEVKPYRTKVREFVSNYSNTDLTRSVVTDFDLPPRYSTEEGTIVPYVVKVKEGKLSYNDSSILDEPYSDWVNNASHSVVEIIVTNGGSGYQAPPQIEIVGQSEIQATATAYISQQAVSKIVVDVAGAGYFNTPEVRILGSVGDDGEEATATAVLGNSLVRSTHLGVKFDRITDKHTVIDIETSQQFNGTNAQNIYNLTWPIDIDTSKTTVFVDNAELLSNDFTVYNVVDTSLGYTRYKGVLDLTSAPGTNTVVTIHYTKDIKLLDAADRIQHYYNPQSGQLGKDLGQLMEGVDYGGVEVTGLSFELGAGWDGLPWFTAGWDNYDETYTDHLIVSDGVTRDFYLPYIPDNGEEINIYHNGVRIDDPNFAEWNAAKTFYNGKIDELAVLQGELDDAQQDLDDAQAAYDAILAEQVSKQNEYDTRDALYNPPYDENKPWSTPGGTDAVDPAEDAALQQLLDDLAQLSIDAVNATNDITVAQDALDDKQAEVDAKAIEVSDALDAFNNTAGIVNENAVMDSWNGTGEDSGPITIPADFVITAGDNFILRKKTSDGSFRPNEQFYDSEIAGGDLEYSSARGIDSGDINIDGDGFVTTTTSHAPEEVITGQVVDAVDITVYHKTSDGSPTILTRHFIADGNTTVFDIGQQPNSPSAVIVKLNSIIQVQDTDYTVNYVDRTIEFVTAPSDTISVDITSMTANGDNILDLDVFVGDGTTSEFISVARWPFEFTVLVFVNGVEVEVETFVTDSNYTEVNNIGFRFETAPLAGDLIEYTVLSGVVRTVSRVGKETIVHDGVVDEYTLTTIPLNTKPLDINVVVEHNGLVLKPADNIYFDVEGNLRTYQVSSSDYAFNSIDATQILVYNNSTLLAMAKDYSWTSSTNQLKIKRGVANVGDKITLVITTSTDYSFVETSNGVNLKLSNSYNDGDIFTVTTFNIHDILRIERNNDLVTTASSLTPGTIDYFKINQFFAGRVQLRSPAVGAQYVWLTLNGKLLTPEVNYVLEDNLEFIQIDPKLQTVDTDVFEVITFNSNVSKQPFAYKLFKDMLNRTFYKRIDDSITSLLAEPLNYYDTQLVLEDASGFLQPLRSQNSSGVILINGERIEYLEKDGNVLKYLRRGVSGTGTPAIHPAGTMVRDQGPTQTIPYKDEIESTVLVASGYNSAATDYSSTGVTITSVTFDTEDQSASMNGGETVTVIGTGFRSNVVAIVGNTPCATTYISSTELTFVTPAKTVGAYDLVILNETQIIGGTTTQETSGILPGGIEYLQIPLPFTPNLTTGVDWYTDTIPLNYGQSSDAEVFVAGKRLRKNSIKVWDPAVGPTSPLSDVDVEAEYSVNGSDYIRLTAPPQLGTKIIVQRKVGFVWSEVNESLVNSKSDQAKFLRAKKAFLPGKVQ